ncbi:hypothetical protein BgiMline_033632 [Biomphalaria glabrata]|nr:CAMitochondrial assembly of ribosomal large subunit protein 1 [Biomphalaria glabrata]
MSLDIIVIRGSISIHHGFLTRTRFKSHGIGTISHVLRSLSRCACSVKPVSRVSCLGVHPLTEKLSLSHRHATLLASHVKPLVSPKFSTLSSKCSIHFHFNSCKLWRYSKNALPSVASFSTEQKHTDVKIADKLKEGHESDLDKGSLDVNSLLYDIQKDFSDTKNASESSEPDEKKSEKKSSSEPKLTPTPTSLFTRDQLTFEEVNRTATEFEYDYRVAEDIEEYEYKDEREMSQQMIRPEKVLPISLERGETGVFELEELLVFLNHLGAENIVTIPIPYEANFCDHMVVASAKSKRHLYAINDEFLWVHKRKKLDTDPHLVIEGLNKSDWTALDLGNIVLHIFYGNAREHYDIESLWTLGPENDPKCKEQNDVSALSAESLFWLETSKKHEADENPENSKATSVDTKT